MTTGFGPQRVDVFAVVTFHPFLLRNLALKPNLVGSLIEPFDTPVLKLALF